MRRQN